MNVQAWVLIGAVIAVLCCTWAFLRGGAVERGAAAIILSGWLLSLLFQNHGYAGPGPVVIAIDIAMLIAFVWLSAGSRRLWTIPLAACQLDAVASHFLSLHLKVGGWSYFTVVGLWGGYGLLVSLVIGMISVEISQRRPVS